MYKKSRILMNIYVFIHYKNQQIMNTKDKKAKNINYSPFQEPQSDKIISSLDTFPMQAALGIYTMNRHTDDDKNQDE